MIKIILMIARLVFFIFIFFNSISFANNLTDKLFDVTIHDNVETYNDFPTEGKKKSILDNTFYIFKKNKYTDDNRFSFDADAFYVRINEKNKILGISGLKSFSKKRSHDLYANVDRCKIEQDKLEKEIVNLSPDYKFVNYNYLHSNSHNKNDIENIFDAAITRFKNEYVEKFNKEYSISSDEKKLFANYFYTFYEYLPFQDKIRDILFISIKEKLMDIGFNTSIINNEYHDKLRELDRDDAKDGWKKKVSDNIKSILNGIKATIINKKNLYYSSNSKSLTLGIECQYNIRADGEIRQRLNFYLSDLRFSRSRNLKSLIPIGDTKINAIKFFSNKEDEENLEYINNTLTNVKNKTLLKNKITELKCFGLLNNTRNFETTMLIDAENKKAIEVFLPNNLYLFYKLEEDPDYFKLYLIGAKVNLGAAGDKKSGVYFNKRDLSNNEHLYYFYIFQTVGANMFDYARKNLLESGREWTINRRTEVAEIGPWVEYTNINKFFYYPFSKKLGEFLDDKIYSINLRWGNPSSSHSQAQCSPKKF